ncbi:MAG TPA: Crp/Fnr family transcriptional regulator [Micromonosporaceae bacterium]|jgi:CRP/FNR family transcriptional regulator|nr:Crp/Fnr family transcriptional regulator [Micromonosporaceae bacterium]
MVHVLDDLPMFSGLPAAEVAALADSARHRRYPDGQVLCTAGDPADPLIVLLHGSARATRESPDGRVVTLARYEAPAGIDKIALLDGGAHPATVTALTDVEVTYLPRAAVLRLLTAHPTVAGRLLATVAGMVRDRDERLCDATLLDVPARVAKWLVRASDAGPVTLPQGQAGLAIELGASRVSVNRALKRFQTRGLVTVRTREVAVLDRAALAQIAE